jgi:ATP-binding cassette, subfamily B, bacterial
MTEERSGSVYDRMQPPADRSLSAGFRLARRALDLAWTAGRGTVVLALVAQVVMGVAITMQLLVAKWLLDRIIDVDQTGGGLGPVIAPLAVFGVLMLIVTGAGVLQDEAARLLTDQVTRCATDRILDVTTTVPLDRFEDPVFHDELERARLHAVTRPSTAVAGVLAATGGLITVASIALALAILSPLLVPLLVLSIVPLWLATTRSARRNHAFVTELTAHDRTRTYLANLLAHRDLAKDVRAYDLGPVLRERHDRLWEERLDRLRRMLFAHGAIGMAGGLVSSVAIIGVVLAVLALSTSGRIDLSAAGAALLAVLTIGQRARTVVGGLGQLYESALFFDDVEHFVTDHGPAPATTWPLVDTTEVTTSGLHYRYRGADAEALRGVDIRINPGEVVALVGENGSGKTTLAKLLAGLYQPTDGTIRWGDHSSDEIDPAAVRQQVAVLFQDFARLWLSAADNIGLGRAEHLDDRARVASAAHRSGAGVFLEALPDAYDTLLSRVFAGGTELSGGQWQRVALARAVFREASLVIMDEPTAALDPRAEHELYTGMRELFADRSVLLISHRFSSVRDADRIYVLAEGAVVEEGTHDQLMAAQGLYHELFTIQASSYLDVERR